MKTDERTTLAAELHTALAAFVASEAELLTARLEWHAREHQLRDDCLRAASSLAYMQAKAQTLGVLARLGEPG